MNGTATAHGQQHRGISSSMQHGIRPLFQRANWIETISSYE